MKHWLMKKCGIIKRRNRAELEIIIKVKQMGLIKSDKDTIISIVKDALDKEFK